MCMPISVLKISRTVAGHIEVAGEFPDESAAHKFVEDSQMSNPGDEHEYSVEFPPSWEGSLLPESPEPNQLIPLRPDRLV